MPIGVPRIIYCWGEELPAQWTDIYNFIFRRRMVFLMQYLDDELCNQICGLLINIHMEDRSKELEKKEIERSGVFKSTTKNAFSSPSQGGSDTKGFSAQKDGLSDSAVSGDQVGIKQNTSFYNKKSRSMEDLLNADEDLGIDEIDTLEQFTLQKITTEWLNWNAQFFDYSDEPYLFYLAELLSKDFNKAQNNLKVNEKNPLYFLTHSHLKQSNKSSSSPTQTKTDDIQQNLNSFESTGLRSSFSPEAQTKARRREPNSTNYNKEKQYLLNLHSQLLTMLKNKKEISNNLNSTHSKGETIKNNSSLTFALSQEKTKGVNKAKIQMGEVYSPFKTNANFSNATAWPYEQESGASIATKRRNTNRKLAQEWLLAFVRESNDDLRKHSFKASKSESTLNILTNASASVFDRGEYKDSMASTRHRGSQQQKESGKSNRLAFPTGNKTIQNLLAKLAEKNFSSKLTSTKNFNKVSEKILGQRNLRREYNLERNFYSNLENGSGLRPNTQRGLNSIQSKSSSNLSGNSLSLTKQNIKSFNYLTNVSSSFQYSDEAQGRFNQNLKTERRNTIANAALARGAGDSQSEFRDYYRKQTERAFIEEESKKVFVIINSFGGSVGNGITVHDALQFIKAGSLTLALGVAASAASLALAGGTIGERYVTEGCHVMIHQPESSIQGQASDIWIDSQEIMKIRLDVADIYSLSTYRPRHKILRDLDRDFYLTATETIQYGLADEIATNEIMSEILEVTNKAWDYYDGKQQRLLETRESASSGLDTQTQN